MNTKDATFAIFRDREEIKVAVRSFLKLGFAESALWAFQVKKNGTKDFSQVQKSEFKNGAILGAIVGATFAGIFFISTNSELFGSRSMMILGGIFLGALVGAAGGTLVGIGTPTPAAKRYGQYLESGGILFSVHSDSPKQIQQAQEILFATGGQDIQLINELKTWNKANLERIGLEKLQTDAALDL